MQELNRLIILNVSVNNPLLHYVRIIIIIKLELEFTEADHLFNLPFFPKYPFGSS